MAIKVDRNGKNDAAELEGVTFANVDLSNRALVAKLRERDLQAAQVRIQDAVRRLQDLGVIDAQGRRLNPQLPPDMQEDSVTDFGG
jgi:hypothetical protein